METDDERPAKRPRNHFEDSIPVRVADSKENDSAKMFYAPRNLIRARSTFFHTAVAAVSPTDSDDETVSVDCPPHTFSRYLHILCTGEVPKGSKVSLYLLVEKLGDVASTNLIIGDIFQNMKDCPQGSNALLGDHVGLIYKDTTKDSPLRHLVSAYATFKVSRCAFNTHFKGWNSPGAAEFFYDVAVRWMEASTVTTRALQREKFDQTPNETWHTDTPVEIIVDSD